MILSIILFCEPNFEKPKFTVYMKSTAMDFLQVVCVPVNNVLGLFHHNYFSFTRLLLETVKIVCLSSKHKLTASFYPILPSVVTLQY